MSLEDLTELSAKAVRVPPTQAFTGRIANDSDGFAPVNVTIPDFDPYLTFGPAPWIPVVKADGIYFPKKGDRALIIRPSDLDVWIAAWEPTAGEADITPWTED